MRVRRFPPEERNPGSAPVAPRPNGAKSVAEFAAPKLAALSQPREFKVDARARARAVAECDAMLASDDWRGARSAHLVALYAKLHRLVYDVDPAELDARGWAHASGAAARMLAREFGGDAARAVEFMRWCWKREEGREKWRRENERSGSRIGWRLQFGGNLTTDWRLDEVRVRKTS